MTPKEKAERLVKLYLNNIKTTPPRCGLVTSEAKQCALICVEQIIEHGPLAYTADFWQSVKQELEKM